MAVLLLVGERKEDPTIIPHMLCIDVCPRKPYYNMAPEEALVLHDCGFPTLKYYYRPDPLWWLWIELKHKWSSLAMQLARVQNHLEYLEGIEMDAADVSAWMTKHFKKQATLTTLPSSRGEEVGEVVRWSHIVDLMKTACIDESGGSQSSKYVSLRDRPGEKTYEERIKEMAGKRKEKYEDNQRKRQPEVEDKEKQKRYRAGLAKVN